MKAGKIGAEALEQRFELRNHENEQNDRHDDGDRQHGHRIEHRLLDLLLEGFGLFLVGRDFVEQRFEGAGLLAGLDQIDEKRIEVERELRERLMQRAAALRCWP